MKNSEKELSLWLYNSLFHKSMPVLIDPYTLRKRGCGQIDQAYLFKSKLVVIEIKRTLRITSHQILRLKYSCEFLSEVFKINCLLYAVSQRKEFLQI